MSNPKIFLQPELIEGDNIDIAQDGKTISSNTPLANITDTDITEVEDGQALIYDETSGKWVNGEGGTPIEPNPTAAATDTLSTIKIDNTVFTIGGGGTGDAVLYPLTTAEYNALTPEQKMDENVLYLLTDGGSGGGGGTGGGFYAPDYENPETITLTPLTWVTYNVTQNGYVMVDLTAFTETGGTSVKVNGTTLNFDKVDGTNYILNSTYMFPVMANDVVEIRLNYDGSGYGSNTALFFPAKSEGGGGSNVIPNPEDEATDVLNSIKIDDTTYAIQGGGSFIDVENRIVAPTEFTTSLTYTATEDCVVCMYLVCPGDASTFVKINDFTVQNFWQAELATGPCAPIFVRAGQTLTVTGAHTTYTSNYTVYGVQSSSGGGGGTEVIPNPQDTPTDTLNTVSIDGTIYDIESGGGSDISVDPEYDTGTLLATISVDDVDHEIYAPEANNILSGTYTPSANVGEDNDIFIKYDGVDTESTYIKLDEFYIDRFEYDATRTIDLSPDYYHIKIASQCGAKYAEKIVLKSDIYPTGSVYIDNTQTNATFTINGNTITVSKNGVDSTRFTISASTILESVPTSVNTPYAKLKGTWFPFPDNEGTEVIANPQGTATGTLTKLSVDGDVYGIPEINVEDVYVNGTSALDENKIAQIKSYQEITKAEYDALPSSKLTDDILYCITDGGATEPGEYFNPVIYSTTEREIGVWTDGKPLYQCTEHIILSTPIEPSTETSVTLSSFSNAEKVFNISVLGGYKGSNSAVFSFVAFMEQSYIHTASDKVITNWNKNLMTVQTGSNYANFPSAGVDNRFREFYVTIQYTKTTDTPGSGKYTTLGVPSVHYSTDEQVIGTWIDGKPLYQKTIHTSGISITLNGIYDFTSLFPLTNTVRDITVIGNYLDNNSPNYFSLGQCCVYFNPNETPAHTLRLNMGSSTRTFEFFITIKYTKTTD